MQTKPYIRIRNAAKALHLTIPTVTSAVNHLVRMGIVKEVSGKHRDRLFAELADKAKKALGAAAEAAAD